MLFGRLFLAGCSKIILIFMKIARRKINLIIGLILISFLSVNFCYAAFLDDTTKGLIENQAETSRSYGGYDSSGNIFSLIQIVINAFLSLIGVMLLAYMLYAGYNWLTARGEEEKVTKAKDTLRRAIIGVIIIVAAYAISIFVMSRLEAGILKSGGTTTGESATSVDASGVPSRGGVPYS